MFSVPGWNLSAPLATQVEKPKPHDPSKQGKKAKKRRRKQEEEVNDGNVGEFWEKSVEGKHTDGQIHDAVAKYKDPSTGEGAQDKRGKKRKREGSKGVQDSVSDETKAANLDGSMGSIAGNITATAGEMKHKKKKRKEHTQDNEFKNVTSSLKAAFTPPASVSLLPPEQKGLTPLQKSMRTKLASARFRHLNESLYTKPSKESLDLFKDDPSMFEDYHRGFAQQVDVWPENPVDGYVSTIIMRGKIRSKDPWKDKKRKEKRGQSAQSTDIDSAPSMGRGDAKPLPRNMKGLCTIADLGCGTASLSYRLRSQMKPANLIFHSFDLSKPSGPSADLVTVADISDVPLPDGSVDVAIFCLALMGTNWLDFIDEAYRILRWRGELWVSEIKSRFGRVEREKARKPPVNSVGSLKKANKKTKGKKREERSEIEGIEGSEDEAELAERVDGVEAKEGTDVSAFVEVLKRRGFVLDAPPERASDAIDLSNKMFVKMQFIKSAQPIKGKNARKGDAKSTLKIGIKGKKFTTIAEDDDGVGDGEEGKVLKPCLYKIR